MDDKKGSQEKWREHSYGSHSGGKTEDFYHRLRPLFFLHEDRGIFVSSRHFFPYLIVRREQLVAIQVVAPMHACRPCHQDCLSRVNSSQARTCSSFVSPESAKDVSVDFPELLNHTGKHINSSTFSIPIFFLSCFQVRSKGGLSGPTLDCIYVAHTIPAVGPMGVGVAPRAPVTDDRGTVSCNRRNWFLPSPVIFLKKKKSLPVITENHNYTTLCLCLCRVGQASFSTGCLLLAVNTHVRSTHTVRVQRY